MPELIRRKANSLLADQFFSPSLFLAERIERGVLEFGGLSGTVFPLAFIEPRLSPTACLSVVELGSGAALPTLLLSTLVPPRTPGLIVMTDYPDENIISNLKSNLERNRGVRAEGCQVHCKGYVWGENTTELL